MNRLQHLALLLALCLVLPATATQLPQSTPEEQGIRSQAIIDLIDSLEALPETQIHHLMVISHGKVVAEAHPAPFTAADRHTLYSVSKTFTAMAVGMAVDDGKLAYTDPIVNYFGDVLPAELPDSVRALWNQVTVQDVLDMRSGVMSDTALYKQHDWLRGWFASPIERPGRYYYDSMASYVLSSLVYRATGRDILSLLNDRLFKPLGIKDAQWELSPDGLPVGGWGLRLTTDDMVRVGIMLADSGRWEGNQVTNSEWIGKLYERQDEGLREAEARELPARVRIVWIAVCGVLALLLLWALLRRRWGWFTVLLLAALAFNGFCYQRYLRHLHDLGPVNNVMGYANHAWYTHNPPMSIAAGAQGQYIIVEPRHQLAVVILSSCNVCHQPVACVSRALIPGVKDKPMKIDVEATQRLSNRISNWTLPTPQGIETTHAATELLGRRLHLDTNSRGLKTLQVDGKSLTLDPIDAPIEHIPTGYKQWKRGRLMGYPPADAPNTLNGLPHDFAAAGAMAWTDDHTLTIDVQYVNWITATRIVIDTAAHTITFTDNFAPTEHETVAYTF